MHKGISPEEKLLSIIKGKQNIPEAPVPKQEIKDIEPVPRVLWSKVDGYISAVLKSDFLKNSILDERALKNFNKYAVIIAAIIAICLFLDIILVSPSRRAALLITKASVHASPVGLAEKTMPIEMKGYSYYSNKMSGRNIFGAGSYADQVPGTEPSAEMSGSNLGLVGIIPGNNPQAIVEEKKNQKTYYLTKGQSINGITVEDINEDKVVLEYAGKKMTLFL